MACQQALGATQPSHGDAVLARLRRRSRATTQLWSGYSRRSALLPNTLTYLPQDRLIRLAISARISPIWS